MGVGETGEAAAGVAAGGRAELGALHFDPSRVPTVPLVPVEGPAAVVAAASPDSSYRLVKAAVDAATRRLDLYIYNVSAEHLLELLRRALARGVAVRLMYDTHDTRGDEKQKIAELAAAGADVRTAPSSGGRRVFTVCHQKFAVVDGRTVLIGSANWAASAIPQVEAGRFKKGNREWLLAIESAALADAFAALFQADWDIPELERPGGLAVEEELEPLPVPVPALLARVPDEVFDLASFPAGPPLTITPIVSPQNYADTVAALVEGARTSVDVQQQYIVEGGGSVRRLLEALAARAGDVEIRVIASPAFRKVGGVDSWERTAESLAAHRLEGTLRAMNLRFYTHCHNKGVIVDRRAVVVSSTNWSDNSIDRAREAGVVVESEDVAGYFASVFDFDWGTAWDAADVPANLAALVEEADARPDGFTDVHPADFA